MRSIDRVGQHESLFKHQFSIPQQDDDDRLDQLSEACDQVLERIVCVTACYRSCISPSHDQDQGLEAFKGKPQSAFQASVCTGSVL